MVNWVDEVKFGLQGFNLDHPLTVLLLNIGFVALGMFSTEFLFNNILEGVWNLGSIGAYASDEQRASECDAIDRPELELILLEAVVDEWEHIQLQIQPDALQKHWTGNPGI